MTAFLIILSLFAVLLVGIPIAFALGGMGAVLIILDGLNPIIVTQALYSSVDSFILLAVPLFLLMSNILLKGGVGRDLFAAVQSWVGHWPGGLAVATVISCAIFAAISGSSIATAATIATVAIPEMTSRGYQRPFVLGLLAAGGTLGILIPPSVPLIVYGVLTEQSIVSLFLAGVAPGLLLAGLFIAFSMLYAAYTKAFDPLPKASWEERKAASIRALPSVGLALIIFIGLYGGVFTPTEAAGVGFVLAIIITALMLRTLTWQLFGEAVIGSMRTTVTIFLIVAGAKIFAKAITLYRIPHEISGLIIDNFDQVGSFIFVVCVALLILGFFLESLSMLLIVVPVLFPALLSMGIDPVWFGIVFMLMIEIALITPPVGLNLFVIQAVGKATLGEVTKGVLPFLAIMLLTVLLIYLFPQIVLFIPFG